MLTIASGWIAASSEVGTVPLFQGCDQLGEIQLLVKLNQQVMGIDEVPQLLNCLVVN